MKRSVKILGVIMALCVFLSSMSVASFALTINGELGYYESDIQETIQFNPETVIPEKEKDNYTSQTVKPFYSNGDADIPYRFYNQLTDRQKELYNIFLENGVSSNIYQITFDDITTYEGTGATQQDAIDVASASINEDMVASITAVTEDNPMLFWFNGYQYGFSYAYGQYANGRYYCRPTKVELTIRIDTNSYTNFADVQKKYTLLQNAVDVFQVNGINRYEKVKSIHDEICEIVTYPEIQGYYSDGSPFYGPMAHQPTGALLSGLAVCEGYAEAFKLICDREGIPCITILGEGGGGGHKWNYVKMDDGKWYLLDATWNDQETFINYENYLIGSDFDGGEHRPTGEMFIADFSLQYPNIEKETYSFSIPMPNTPDMAFNNTNGVLYVGKDVDNYLEYIGITDDYTVSLTSYNVTGTRITFEKTSDYKSKTYLIAVRGDINSDDITSENDYNKVVRVTSTTDAVNESSGEYYAGDMTQDGAIDGFDAIALDLYLKGTLMFD